MRILMLTAFAVLAACSPAPAPPANDSAGDAVPIESPRAPAPTPAPSPIALQAVTESAVGTLEGELRCAFLSDEGMLLLAGAADVDADKRATAVVMRAGKPVGLTASETGGFDALSRGGAFTGEGLTASLTRGAERPTEHEGSSHTATLSIEGTGLAARAIDGVWECGP